MIRCDKAVHLLTLSYTTQKHRSALIVKATFNTTDAATWTLTKYVIYMMSSFDHDEIFGSSLTPTETIVLLRSSNPSGLAVEVTSETKA